MNDKKKSLLLIVLVFSVSFAGSDIKRGERLFTAKSYGIPASPYAQKYIQPDGTVITYYNRGDGAVSWQESTEGLAIIKNGRNYYEYAITSRNEKLIPSGIKVGSDNTPRSATEMNFIVKGKKGCPYSDLQINIMHAKYLSNHFPGEDPPKFPGAGKNNILTLFIKFPGAADPAPKFTIGEFQTFLNSSVGVQGYFVKNFYDRLTINCVCHTLWYTAKENGDYYGNNKDPDHIRCRDLVRDAIQAADIYIDFKQFAHTSPEWAKKYAFPIIIIFAGRPAPSSQEPTNKIVPYRGRLEYALQLDGKLVTDYIFCSELNGDIPETKPAEIVGVGQLAHEISHLLGAPDHYDTDYTGTNGESPHLGAWDVMASGCHNNDSKSPPLWNYFEKLWFNSVNVSYGSLTNKVSAIEKILNISENPRDGRLFELTDNHGYTTEAWYFENRQQIGDFDKGLPGHGLLVYHANEKNYGEKLAGGKNTINVDPYHQDFDLIEATPLKKIQGVNSCLEHGPSDAFPGSNNVIALTSNGNMAPTSNTFDGKITFTLAGIMEIPNYLKGQIQFIFNPPYNAITSIWNFMEIPNIQ